VTALCLKAARFHSPLDVRLEELAEPEAGKGEVVIRVLASNMCGTDLKSFLRGHPLLRPPITMGHEYCGVVVAAGEGAPFKEGERVVASNSAPCMRCEMCSRGSYSICTSIKENMVGFSLPGSYAELMRIPAHIVSSNTYRFSGPSPEEIACAEPLASVIHALDRVSVEEGETAAVVGAGALGLMFLQLLKARGAKVIVANRSEARLEVAERLGADVLLSVSDENLVSRLKDATDGVGADLVVEAVGRKETWEACFMAARDGGTVLQFGGCQGGTVVAFDAGKIHYGETTVVGSFHHEPSAFRRAVNAIELGEVDVAPFLTHRVRLEDILEAFELMKTRQAMKVSVLP